jgi:hypothetical protein
MYIWKKVFPVEFQRKLPPVTLKFAWRKYGVMNLSVFILLLVGYFTMLYHLFDYDRILCNLHY